MIPNQPAAAFQGAGQSVSQPRVGVLESYHAIWNSSAYYGDNAAMSDTPNETDFSFLNQRGFSPAPTQIMSTNEGNSWPTHQTVQKQQEMCSPIHHGGPINEKITLDLSSEILNNDMPQSFNSFR